MKISKILCPIDFSDFNPAANQYASLLAHATGAEILYLHVSFPEVPVEGIAAEELRQENEYLLTKLKTVEPTQAGVKASYHLEFGMPSKVIVQFAKQHSANLIVVGTHGRTGWRRVLMGSVAEVVIRNAQCPVLAIKPETDRPEEGESE